ncbi:hypothetical protein E1N52_07310 [Paraburkholderia guartelaensis]|uniref:Uncharacterized protein n=1 Tax=Paraburkholderia guartelaensis TaxID=2546446 RepID=A0A4R5LJ51_9BURK|nr:hypothetical protein [Paraburkholderia guartelaensis]TDG09586.1 hypothetical protein E1N52_07310 [Paraburkholderia guartelaensis]
MPINCMGSPRTGKRGSGVDLAGSPAAFQAVLRAPGSAPWRIAFSRFPWAEKTVSHAVLPRPVVQKHTVSMCHVLSAAQQDYIC